MDILDATGKAAGDEGDGGGDVGCERGGESGVGDGGGVVGEERLSEVDPKVVAASGEGGGRARGGAEDLVGVGNSGEFVRGCEGLRALRV